MSRGTVASGWCPVDDRVYERTDGVCPDCGTALVDTGPAAPSEAPLPERPASSSPVVRGAIVVAILGAFLLGVSLPRGEEQASPRATSSPALVAQDVRVGTVAHAAAGDLRLDRLIQDGDTFSATFTPVEGFPDLQLIRGVSVEVSTVREDGTPDVFGVSDVEITRFESGVMVRGSLEPRSGRISELQMSSFQMAVTAKPEWRVGIGGIWPVRGAEPAVLHDGRSRVVGDGSIRLVSIVSWRDRLEVAFELKGLRAGDTGNFAINEIEIETLRGSGVGRNGTSSVLPATVQDQISPSQIVARFEGLPPGLGTVTIRASRLSRYLAGPWTWRIA
jgi:hypothetical protein